MCLWSWGAELWYKPSLQNNQTIPLITLTQTTAVEWSECPFNAKNPQLCTSSPSCRGIFGVLVARVYMEGQSDVTWNIQTPFLLRGSCSVLKKKKKEKKSGRERGRHGEWGKVGGLCVPVTPLSLQTQPQSRHVQPREDLTSNKKQRVHGTRRMRASPCTNGQLDRRRETKKKERKKEKEPETGFLNLPWRYLKFLWTLRPFAGCK